MFLQEPFYIGKGKGRRFQNRTKSCRSAYFRNKLRRIEGSKLEPVVLKIAENLNEQDAFRLEMRLIKEIGRVDVKSGPLTNLTNGGEGASGHVWSEEARKRMSEARKGKRSGYTHSVEMKRWMSETRKGRHATEETRKKISGENHHGFGKFRSEETKRKISEKHKGMHISEEVKRQISDSKKGYVFQKNLNGK